MSVAVAVYDCVEVAAIDYGVEKFIFMSMQKRDSIVFNNDLGESFMYGAVFCFTEPFFEEFMVAVVVAKYADESAVKLGKSGYCERGYEVTCVEHQFNLLLVKGFYCGID
jgi:hypothetical protein